VTGGIIAAGEGRRLREGGYTVPKPMVPVAGVPLIEGVIRNFLAADVASLTVIVNEDEGDCVKWLAAQFPALDMRLIVRTTASSLESFTRVLAAAPAGPLVVSTVDAWCRPEDFVGFVDAARRRPADAVVLAVTPLVADESPLWAVLDGDGRIRSLGGKSGNVVTAGIYLVPERVRGLSPPPGLGRLREFLAWLVTRGEIVYGVTVDRVVDVDRSADVILAESLARRPTSVEERPGFAGA
jgi:NDP-sugar pyrophosphorylase family protein